ncbi:MAG: amino acid racemase [Planctomycetota bacterium]
MAKHIGIVAVSPEGSALCYRMIGRRASEIDDPALRPLLTLHNRPFNDYVDALQRDDWNAIAQLLIQSAQALAAVGCDFCVLPDNVAHHALQMAEVSSPLPFLNMIELVADQVERSGCDTVALLGTKFVMRGSTYQTLLGLRGIKLVIPEDHDADMIDEIIFREAVYGRVRPESRELVERVVHRLRERGCEAIILASTEGALMVDPSDGPVPVLDPLELLADAAIVRACNEESMRETA